MWNVMFVYNGSKLPNHILNFTFNVSVISKKHVLYVSLKRVTSFSKQANTDKWLLWSYMSLILLTWIEFSIKDPISRECSLHRSTSDVYNDTVNIIYIQNLSRMRHITLCVALFTKQWYCLLVFTSHNQV